jgi:hypothetical protein
MVVLLNHITVYWSLLQCDADATIIVSNNVKDWRTQSSNPTTITPTKQYKVPQDWNLQEHQWEPQILQHTIVLNDSLTKQTSNKTSINFHFSFTHFNHIIFKNPTCSQPAIKALHEIIFIAKINIYNINIFSNLKFWSIDILIIKICEYIHKYTFLCLVQTARIHKIKHIAKHFHIQSRFQLPVYIITSMTFTFESSVTKLQFYQHLVHMLYLQTSHPLILFGLNTISSVV